MSTEPENIPDDDIIIDPVPVADDIIVEPVPIINLSPEIENELAMKADKENEEIYLLHAQTIDILDNEYEFDTDVDTDIEDFIDLPDDPFTSNDPLMF